MALVQPHVIVITGPVGAGKTTSMNELAELLDRRGESVAMVDLDGLRALWPPDPEDPFHAELGMANLSAIWPEFASRGARWLVLSDVVEHPDQRISYQRAIPDSVTTIVRLEVPLARVHERLRRRESGESLDWHLHRSGELQQLMTERGVGDIVITVDGHSPGEVAAMIFTAVRQHVP